MLVFLFLIVSHLLRNVTALLCQLLWYGDNWRRGLPSMERRHYPGVSRERKSIVSGNAHHHHPIAANNGTLSSEDTPLTWFVFLLLLFRWTSGSPGWRRQKRKSLKRKLTEEPAKALMRHLSRLVSRSPVLTAALLFSAVSSQRITSRFFSLTSSFKACND